MPRFLTAICKCTQDFDISQIKTAGKRSVSSGIYMTEQENLTKLNPARDGKTVETHGTQLLMGVCIECAGCTAVNC